MFVYLHVMIKATKYERKNMEGIETTMDESPRKCLIDLYRYWLNEPNALEDVTLLPPRPSNSPLHSFVESGWVYDCDVHGGSENVLRIIREIHVKTIPVIGHVLGRNHALRKLYINAIDTADVEEFAHCNQWKKFRCRVFCREKDAAMKRILDDIVLEHDTHVEDRDKIYSTWEELKRWDMPYRDDKFVESIYQSCKEFTKSDMDCNYADNRFTSVSTQEYFDWLGMTFDMIYEMDQRVFDSNR